MTNADTIFGSDLFGAIIQAQIADAQSTQAQIDRYHQDKEAQLIWLREEIAHFAGCQDSKMVEHKLLSILQRSYKVTDQGLDKETY
ncbi:hypothetical protein BEN60_gp046 [Gordonia phage Smoothie]|uniref:Uncharacterized protein n=1 Tax=Gordonia phage Smoothie TaxID=1838078 RepID=A0A160DEI4_9CAUD|nr:hypothetical protein BEN60_gp046 [Gordonia phage Smoothie]ANA86316.1 hypothetical protein PBI_SMOOTHIE_161 [Gordonia phage Smoothie]